MKYMAYAVLIFFLLTCSETIEWKRQIKKCEVVSLFEINRTPSEPSMQDPEKRYCLDYEIQNSINLTAEQIKLFKKYLINQNNYSTENLKRCPFLPEYAITLGDSLSAVISLNPCSKILFKDEISKQEKMMDLVANNEIEKLIEIILDQNK